MPAVSKVIKETKLAISRPVIQGVTKAVMAYTGIDGDVEIQNYTDANSSPTTPRTGGDDTRFESHAKVYVEHTETYREDNLLIKTVNWNDTPPIFTDDALTTYLRPVKVKAEVVLNITYRCANEGAAQQWVNDIRQRISMERAELPLEASYSYQIPRGLLVILAHIHDLREQTAPYGDTLVEYFRQHFDPRVTVETTATGTQSQLAVAERQGGFVGWFDFTAPPTPDRNTENSTWNVNFTFTFIYDKPISVVLEYPIIVHNQLIDDRFHKVPDPYTLTEPGVQDISRRVGVNLPYTRAKRWHSPLGGVIVPSYDDWYPPYLPDYTSSLFTALISVDPTDPFQICNLNDLGEYQIHPVLLDYYRNNRDIVLSVYRSPLLVSFYVGGTPYPPQGLYLDADLNLRAANPMDPRQVHHLRLALLVDLTVLSEPYQKRFRMDGKACRQILSIIDSTLEDKGLLPRLRGGKMVAAEDYHKALMEIRTTDPVYKTRPERCRLTVANFLIEVR